MKRSFTLEQSLYLLAFLIGLFLRLFRLDLPALGETEAGWALQALHVSRGDALQIGSQPGYVVLTGLLFWLMGSTNFLARLLPALAGSLLIFLPYLWRGAYEDSEWLRKAGMVMAFGLALDPGLVALSRQAGSPILAVTFAMLSLAMIYRQKWVLVGLFSGLALLSGPALVAGVAGLLLAWGLFQLLRKLGGIMSAQIAWHPIEAPAAAWRKAWLALGVTILTAGLLFLRVPQGLGALAKMFPDYLAGWLQAPEVPALRLPAALLVYQPLALIFGLIATVRAWVSARSGLRSAYFSQLFSLWAFAALLLAFIYPARQVADLAWTLIPLWALAALEISRHIPSRENRPTHWVALGLAGLTLLLLIVAWINLLSLMRMNSDPRLYLAVILGILLMIGIATVLVGVGWSYPSARLGFHWGLAAGLSLWLFSNTIAVSFVRPNNPRELYSPIPDAGQVAELVGTLHAFSNWNTGLDDQIEMVVGLESNALRWALRAYPNVTFDASLSAAASPPVVITLKDQASPILAQAYRGQDFVLSRYAGWPGALPTPLLPWVAYRRAPIAQLEAVLWVRADVFPGGALNLLELAPGEELAPLPAEEYELEPKDKWLP